MHNRVCVECKKAWETLPGARSTRSKWRATPEGRAEMLLHSARLNAKRQAQRAAEILTETLGVPHVVVKMDDGTFQPVRADTLNVDSSQ